MSMQRDTAIHDDDTRFDAAMRTLHRDALAQVTPSVRWRLKPASLTARSATERNVALRAAPLWAGAVAAVCAVAVGVGLWRAPDPAAAAATPAQFTADDSATVLGEDPDFYAWLASDDADLVAME